MAVLHGSVSFIFLKEKIYVCVVLVWQACNLASASCSVSCSIGCLERVVVTQKINVLYGFKLCGVASRDVLSLACEIVVRT